MAVEESRLLQVSIFSTLHKNVKHLEFNLLLPDVVTIADEVDAQLKATDIAFHGCRRTGDAKARTSLRRIKPNGKLRSMTCETDEHPQ